MYNMIQCRIIVYDLISYFETISDHMIKYHVEL